jgi:hypothetical protein
MSSPTLIPHPARTAPAPLLALALLLGSSEAAAKPHVSGRIVLSGMFYGEQEQPTTDSSVPQLASLTNLAYVEGRAVLAADGLFADHLALRFDGRVRGTGSFDFERKFDPLPLAAPPPTISARGYLGGQEFDVRELHLTLRLHERVRLRLGRMLIPDADLLKLDGARLHANVGEHWVLAGFFGGAPHPFSRSVLTDYVAVCGSGVAVGISSPAAGARCLNDQPLLSLGGGVTARYQYESIWGSLAAVAVGGLSVGDGGPVVVGEARSQSPTSASPSLGNLQPSAADPDAPRVYLSWVNHVTLRERLDLHSDLVVDAVSSAGPQLTRALLSASLRLLRDDRLRIGLSYSHLSSLAINMFLSRQVYNRFPNGSALALGNTTSLGFVENNLSILRTGRDEGRLNLDFRLVARLLIFGEGRLRKRALIGGDSNPTVYDNSPLYTTNTRDTAGDLSVGLRDSGSLGGVRAGLSYLLLLDYRAQSHVVRMTLGRSFAKDRLSVDLDYAASMIQDLGQSTALCSANLQPAVASGGITQLNPAVSAFSPDCFGRRSGVTHDVGGSILLNPWRRLFFAADYRFTALLSDPQNGVPVPTVLAHTALGRVEITF